LRNGLYIIDFHTHLAGHKLHNFSPEDQKTKFYQKLKPVFEPLSNFTEPLHGRLSGYFALNVRDPISRVLYNSFAWVGLMEVLRLFKKHNVTSLLEIMDKNGIDHSVICSLEPFITTEEILEVIRPHRARLSLFASVARDEVDGTAYFAKFVESGEISGLKIHPLVGGYACGELFDRTKGSVQVAVDHNLPIMFHAGHIPKSTIAGLTRGCEELESLEPLIAAFPTGKFILAHIGWELWREVLLMAKKYPNISVETSWQPARIIRRAIDELGPERVIFGSDFPIYKQSSALKQVEKAVTDREFVYVANVNAKRMLEGSKIPRRLESSES
jgi:predicted TIM-barrel fold metal-dependent hydrolase